MLLVSLRLVVIYSYLSCLLLFYRALNTLLPVLRKQYLTLKEAGLTTSLTESEFGEVEQLVQRQKSVVWADQTEEKEQSQNHELELSAIFAFPQLVRRLSTPCCKYTISLFSVGNTSECLLQKLYVIRKHSGCTHLQMLKPNVKPSLRPTSYNVYAILNREISLLF